MLLPPILAMIGLTGVSALADQHPLNLSFEVPSVEGFARPWGWNLVSISEGAEASLDSTVRKAGRRSLKISRAVADSGRSEGRAGHALRFWIAPRFAWGDRVRLRGWIRADPRSGTARLTLEAWGGGVLDSDTASLESSDGEASWRQLELAIDVDSTAHSVFVTAGLTGVGTVWFDDLSIEARGRTWETVPVASFPTDDDVDWLARRSFALVTVDAPSITVAPDFSDLSAFSRIVGDAKIVALGEATHGTSEFFRIKHRLTDFLARELGFRVFMIEANQLAVESINRYVQGEPGDAVTVMKSMFRVWNTEEMRDFIEWIRSYNGHYPDRTIEFIGFDMQDPTLPIDSLDAFLARVQPELRVVAESLYVDYRQAWRRGPYPQDTDSMRLNWFDHADEMWHHVTAQRTNWLHSATSRSDTVQVEWAIQNANVVRQAALSAYTQDFATRDSAMAENIRWALDRRDPETRAVVWAHDGHISKAGDPRASYFGGSTMGSFVSKSYGDDYRAFGLLTFQGKYTGSLRGNVVDVDLFPGPVGSVEEALHRIAEGTRSPLLVTDLRGAEQEPNGAWLIEPRLIRMIGYAAEDWGFATPISVGRQFDGVIFVDASNPSRLISRD